MQGFFQGGLDDYEGWVRDVTRWRVRLNAEEGGESEE